MVAHGSTAVPENGGWFWWPATFQQGMVIAVIQLLTMMVSGRSAFQSLVDRSTSPPGGEIEGLRLYRTNGPVCRQSTFKASALFVLQPSGMSEEAGTTSAGRRSRKQTLAVLRYVSNRGHQLLRRPADPSIRMFSGIDGTLRC